MTPQQDRLLQEQRRARLAMPASLVPRRRPRTFGTVVEFWRFVDKQSDELWIWQGPTNSNHNGKECVNYRYGHFELVEYKGRERVRCCKSALVHRIILFLTHEVEVPDNFDVVALDENRLNVSPLNLALRDDTGRSFLDVRAILRSLP